MAKLFHHSSVLLLVSVFLTPALFCSIQKTENSNYACGRDDMVTCTIFATNWGNYDRLQCCVHSAKLLATPVNCNRFVFEILNKPAFAYKSTLAINGTADNSCVAVEYFEGLPYNISLSDDCHGESNSSIPNKLYEKTQSEFDEEFDPIMTKEVKVWNITREIAIVSWNVTRCSSEGEVSLYDSSGFFMYSTHVDCPRQHSFDHSCNQEVNVVLDGLQPYANYSVAISQKPTKSQCWSRPTKLHFLTAEAEPLSGPEISSGVLIANPPPFSCFQLKQNSEPLNITLFWKQPSEDKWRGKNIVKYSMSVEYKTGDANFLYEQETTSTCVTMSVVPISGAASSWCTTPVIVNVWAHTVAGRSLTSSNLTMRFDELLESREVVKFDENQVFSLPTSKDTITLYWQESTTIACPTYWESFFVGNLTVPFPVPRHRNRRDLLGMSANTGSQKGVVAETIIQAPVKFGVIEEKQSFLPLVMGVSALVLAALILLSLVVALFLAWKKKIITNNHRSPTSPKRPNPWDDDQNPTSIIELWGDSIIGGDAIYQPPSVPPSELNVRVPSQDVETTASLSLSSPPLSSGYTATAGQQGANSVFIANNETSSNPAPLARIPHPYQIDDTTSPDETDEQSEMSTSLLRNTQHPVPSQYTLLHSPTPTAGMPNQGRSTAYQPVPDALINNDNNNLPEEEESSYQPIPLKKSNKQVRGYTPVFASSSSSSSD